MFKIKLHVTAQFMYDIYKVLIKSIFDNLFKLTMVLLVSFKKTARFVIYNTSEVMKISRVALIVFYL